MQGRAMFWCALGFLLAFPNGTLLAATYTIDDCIKSARNGSEICDDAAFHTPSNPDLVLVCLDDNGGKAYVSSNTGPKMSDGMARCQGWEEKGQNAWDHLNYLHAIVCDQPQKLVPLNVNAGQKYWMGIHDHPKVGKGHFTMACLAPNKGGGVEATEVVPPTVSDPPPPTLTAVSIFPPSGWGCATTFEAAYEHSQGAQTFRIVQLWIGDEVAPEVPVMGATLEYGIFQSAGQTCQPGEDKVIEGEYGSFDCANSWFVDEGNVRRVYFAITFDLDTFSGTKNIYFDAKGGSGDPEPRLGWTKMGTFTIVDDADAMGCTPVRADTPSPTSPYDRTPDGFPDTMGSDTMGSDTMAGNGYDVVQMEGNCGGCSGSTGQTRYPDIILLLCVFVLLVTTRRMAQRLQARTQ